MAYEVYGGSLTAALRDIYPEHSWDLTKFAHAKAPSDYFDDVNNQRKFLDNLKQQLGITTYEELASRATYDLIESHGGTLSFIGIRAKSLTGD